MKMTVETLIEDARDRMALEKEFRSDLLAEGWVDAGWEGARFHPPNGIPGDFPILVRWRSPHDGLYYRFRDALRISLGKQPKRPGIPKES